MDKATVIVMALVFIVTNARGGNLRRTQQVSLTLLRNANETGAVCLDGSAAAYYYDPGFGGGLNSWIVYLNGGGWCASDVGCKQRLTSGVGSSKNSDKMVFFGQLLSRNKTINPDFYNWHRISIVYCDSSSFMGTSDHHGIKGRGARIFDVVIQEFLHKGMKFATNAILSGGSAGGLAAMLHCDAFRPLLPSATRVKCLIDSGFFLHAPKLGGAEYRADKFAAIAAYHGFTNKLPSPCRSRMNASRCIFPEYIIKDIETPLFLVESKFDQYQLSADHIRNDPSITDCINNNATLCTPTHFETMREYGIALTDILEEIRDSSSIGMFVHPCLRHAHFHENLGWDASYKFKNKTIAQAIGDWYHDRSCIFQEIDTDHNYPLTKDCTKSYTSSFP